MYTASTPSKLGYIFNVDLISFANEVIELLSHMGYFGVICIMAIESTFLPVIIPSEVFLISYGAAAYKGDMHLALIISAASFGILVGSFVNYYMASWLGRAILYKYGKYLLLPEHRIRYWEERFLKYSKFVIFFGRFIPIPAVKHIITIPAGLSRMNVKLFAILTTLGGGIFSTMVVLFGYWFGKKVDTVENFSSFINKAVIVTLLFIFIPIIAYKIYRFCVKNQRAKIIS